MSSRQTTQKVREFEMTLEDAGRLAECLNSFDDSDSWPGGFTHGNPFTAERVLKSWSKEKNIRVIVGYSDDKIVGHCNISNAELDDEASYIGLLGVNPHYQGQGFGKAMLIEAAQAAADAGKRRVDLHTWGGNLKAVPLYKRTGYNWVPGTQVLMESHIPGIIGAKMFKEFFERHDWYDSFKVNITQEMDDFFEDGIGIFKYNFEGTNGDKLYVTIDREAKGICGFELTLDGETISAHLRPKNHTGYIGLGESEIKLSLRNGMSSDQRYSIQFKPIRDVSIELDGDLSGILPSDDELVLRGTMSIMPNTRMLDRETNAWEKAKTQGEFTFTIGDREINLFTGIIPTDAISLSTAPLYPCVAPGKESVLGFGLQNNSTEKIAGKILLTPPKNIELKDTTIDFEIMSGKAIEFPLTLTTSDTDDNSVLQIGIAISVMEDSKLVPLLEKTLNIPVIGISGAVVYEGIGENYMLETESIRIGVRKTPSMAILYTEYKPLKEVMTGWGQLPDVGYPFSGEGSEWYRAEFDVSMSSSDNTAELVLTADSTERPGLRYSIIHRVHRGLDLIDTIVKLENNGSEVLTNLGVQTHGWFRMLPDQMHVPLRNEVVSLDSIDWNGRRQLPRSPKEYHENWVSTQKQGGGILFGRIWDAEFIEDVSLTRSSGTHVFEHKLPDMKPKDVLEFTPVRTIITLGSWEKVRNFWARTRGSSEVTPRDVRIAPRSDLEFDLVPKGFSEERRSISPIFVDAGLENEMEFRLRVVHENPISVKCQVKMPKGIMINGKEELSFEIEEVGIDKPFTLPVKIVRKTGNDWFVQGGEILLEFSARIVRESLDAVVFDSTIDPERKNTFEDGSELMTTTISGYSFAVSPQNIGGLVRYSKVGEPSMFYDTFPKVEPFIWWDKAYSGFNPVLVGFNTWHWEAGLQKETWDITEISSGSWFGYETVSALQHIPGLKGMTATMRYMLLAGTPLLRLEVELKNTSSLWKLPYIGFKGFPTPGGDARSKIHTIHQGERIEYEPTGNASDIWAFPKAGWGAYEGLTSGKILGLISTTRNRESFAIDTLGDKAHHLTFRAQPKIAAGESVSAVMYLLDTDSIEQIELMKDIPEHIE